MNKHSLGQETSNHMVVMPSNNSGIRIGRLCGMYPQRLGWLIGPGGWRKPPSWMPVALDNGAYGAWEKKKPWDEAAWWDLLVSACDSILPLWAVIPDVVTNREATLKLWDHWSPIVKKHFPNLPQAFAVQDGMTPPDVPKNAEVVFVGGSFDWKWANVSMWTSHFPRVHIARVNTENLLWKADRTGAESCDGTGWFRFGDEKIAELEHYLEFSSRLDRPCPRILSDPADYYEILSAPKFDQRTPLGRLLSGLFTKRHP